MFKPFTYFSAILMVCGLAACADEDFDPRLEVSGVPALSAPAAGAEFLITEENLNDTMVTFAWSATNTSVPTEVRYVLEADTAGGDFSAPFILRPSGVEREAGILNRTVNQYLINNDFTPGETTALQVRVRSIVGLPEDGRGFTSEVMTINVIPYASTVIRPDFIYVPGAYQGWSPPTAPQLYPQEDPAQYDGFIYIGGGGEFKFVGQPDWSPIDLGDNDADGLLDAGGANITAAGDGFHRLQINYDELTYTQTPTSWGIIGNATPTGWDSDTDLTYDSDNEVLTVTIDLEAGTADDGRFIKFRANDGWDINFGDPEADGELTLNAGDIPISESGNYTVTLDLQREVPTYTLTKN